MELPGVKWLEVEIYVLISLALVGLAMLVDSCTA
jgi:hypothetical protein